MTIILNSEILLELKNNKTITLAKKYQKDSNNYNFFINPKIGFKLYKPKVIDITTNNIVFEYNKKEALNLFIFLKNINEHIIDIYKKSDSYETKTIYNLYMDKEEIFTIRCYLPHTKYKYFIKQYNNNEEYIFKLPQKGAIYDEVYIDIRNLWIKDNKVGYNLELKQTNIN